MIRSLFTSKQSRPRGQAGWRAYVVGDVHGRLDLLDQLLAMIASDHAGREPARGLLVFLGDIIDRGPQSAEVIERLRSLDVPGLRRILITGNHEEVLRDILQGDHNRIDGWLRFGGAETLLSYGVVPEAVAAMSPEDAVRRIATAVPPSHRQFLENFADSLRFGDYLFVHAGIRPGVSLEQQNLADLRWIREPFLSDRRDHGMIVVHGHTISEAVEVVGSRIGIDTGAYATGRLTALAIEGERRWLLDTVDGLHDPETSVV